jgi:hypothetical protein
MEKRGLNVFYWLRCPCLLSFFECMDLMSPDTGKKTIFFGDPCFTWQTNQVFLPQEAGGDTP